MKRLIEICKEKWAKFRDWLRGEKGPGGWWGRTKETRAGVFLARHKTAAAWISAVAVICLVVVIAVNSRETEPVIQVMESLTDEERGEILAASASFNTDSFSVNGTFYLDNAKWLSAKEVEESLFIKPFASFKVLALDNDRYQIRFDQVRNVPYTVTFTEPFTNQAIETVLDGSPFTVKLSGLNSGRFSINDQITLSFSHEVLLSDLYDHLMIYPDLAYDLVVDEDIAWIIPYEPLDYDTNYQIIVEEGLQDSKGSRALEETQFLSLTTQSPSFKVSLTSSSDQMLRPEDDIQLDFSAINQSSSSIPMILELYKFPNLDQFLSQAEILVNYDVDLSPLERVDVYMHQMKNNTNRITINNPGVGGYILSATVTNPFTDEVYQFRKAYTVSDYAIYAQTSGSQTLVWANSSATGEALPGHMVEFRSASKEDPLVSAVTDGDGIAIMNYVDPEGERYYRYYSEGKRIMSIRNPEGQVVYVDNTAVLNRSTSTGVGDRYYSFFQTDRPLYKPTDEVNFWGFIRAYQYNQNPVPDTALIVFGDGSLNQEVEVSISPDGTYKGVVPLESIKSNNYRITVKLPSPDQTSPEAEAQEEEEEPDPEEVRVQRDRVLRSWEDRYSQTALADDEEEVEEETEPEPEPEPEIIYFDLESQYVQVKDYQKPTFLISTETDKSFYMPGDKVTVTITPSFYDGTPLPNYPLQLRVRESYYDSYAFMQDLTTNAEGVATFTFSAYQRGQGRSTSWLPNKNRFDVLISQDGQNILEEGSYYYYPTDMMLYGSVEEQENGNYRLTVETNHLDTEAEALSEAEAAYNSFEYQYGQYERFRGDPMDAEITGEVSYSFYNEDGKWVNEKQEIELKTVDGVAQLEDLVDVEFDPERYFYMTINLYAQDSYGRQVAATRYYNNGYSHSSSTSTAKERYSPGFNYRLSNQDGVDITETYYSYTSYSSVTLSQGDTLNFTMHYQDRPFTPNGRILYTILQEEIIDRGFTTQGTLSITESVELANTFNLVAAYFDGTEVWPIRNTVVTLNKESIRLNVEVTPDKASYQPGEQVSLQVRVTDQGGNGVASTTCLSIVDEAIYALREHDINVMNDLFSDMYFNHYYVVKYATGHGDFVHEYGGDAGKGAGPGMRFLDNLRKNFRDTALFELVRTDAGGNGSITFTLPDNVTSWRITGVSIGDNLYAGQSKDNIVSTMPFFVQPVISSKYIAGDEVAMLVQAHGIALDKDSEIYYTVTVTGSDGFEDSQEIGSTAYVSNLMNFGQLEEGEYTVMVTAESGEYIDAVELPLAVVSSNLELVVNRKVDLQQGVDINAVRYPVTLTFYDQAHEAYYSSISSLLTHYCMQSGQRMSRFVAKRALNQHMDSGNIPQHIQTGNNDAGDMQNADGGIGNYLGGESIHMTTVKVLIVAKDQFDLVSMASYFRNITETSKDTYALSAAYLGLAVIGDEAAQEIYTLLQDEEYPIPLFQRIYLIAGLAYLGDTDTAMHYYQEEIAPRMIDMGDGKYFRSELDDQDNAELTNAAWIAASVLGVDDADGISVYLGKNSWRISSLFECMIYITHYNKELIGDETTLTYTVNGQSHTVDLGLGGRYSVVFSKSELEGLEFTDVPDTISAVAYYIGEPDEVDIQPSPEITVEREITEMKDGLYDMTLTITFTEDAPGGYYDVSEWIPSNMRLYSVDKADERTGTSWYNYTTEGQKIYFKVYHYRDTESITIRYKAQRTYDVEAVVDRAYVIHGDSGINGFSERTAIK